MILVTGGMGFIGLHTARRLVDAGERLVLTQFRRRREPPFIADELGGAVQVEQLDVVDREAMARLVERHEVDSIVHLAVPGLGGLSPGDEYRTNVQALINVLEIGSTLPGRTTVASSVAVYAGCGDGPYREDRPLPVVSASATEAYKKAEEILGLHVGGQLDVDVRFVRIAQIYGPLYHTLRNLPSRVAHAATRGTELELADAERTSGAHRSADLCFVADCADGIARLHTSSTLRHRVYNLGAGHGVTPAQVVAAARAVLPDADLPTIAADDASTSGDHMAIDRIREDTGYDPSYDIERGMAAYLRWLQDHEL